MLSQRDLYLILGMAVGVVIYYKLGKPLIDQYI